MAAADGAGTGCLHRVPSDRCIQIRAAEINADDAAQLLEREFWLNESIEFLFQRLGLACVEAMKGLKPGRILT